MGDEVVESDEIVTGSANTTIEVAWPCDGGVEDLYPDLGCDWHEMHHTDDQGNHWCPTGFMFCHNHAGVGRISGPGMCNLWGEPPSLSVSEGPSDGR